MEGPLPPPQPTPGDPSPSSNGDAYVADHAGESLLTGGGGVRGSWTNYLRTYPDNDRIREVGPIPSRLATGTLGSGLACRYRTACAGGVAQCSDQLCVDGRIDATAMKARSLAMAGGWVNTMVTHEQALNKRVDGQNNRRYAMRLKTCQGP